MISHVGVRVHAYVEKAAAQNVKRITVEDEKEREQEDHDAHVSVMDYMAGGCRGHAAF